MYIEEYTKKFFLNIFSFGSNFVPIIFKNRNYCIFMYHRVVPNNEYKALNKIWRNLSISTKSFENHMKFLSENYEIDKLDNIDANDNSKKIKVYITFDDGYLDNLTTALPILEKYSVPATIFITTRFIEQNVWLWWSDLWEKILQKNSLEFYWRNKYYKFITKNEKQKINSFKIIRNLFIKLNSDDQNKLLLKILNSKKTKNYNFLFLDWNQINFLNNHKLISIGSHTKSHPSLSSLIYKEMEEELRFSKLLIQKKLGTEITLLAYPFGGNLNAGVREFDCAKKIGYKVAVTTDINASNSNFSLPRYSAPNYLMGYALKAKINGIENILKRLFKIRILYKK